MCQLVFFFLHAYRQARDCNLTYPVSLTEQSGSFVLKDGMKIGVSDQSLFPAAGYLQEILRNVISSSVEVTTDKSQVDMYFQLKDTVGKPSSYKLESTPEYIRVEATDYSGIISAITTIRQLLPATIEVQERNRIILSLSCK